MELNDLKFLAAASIYAGGISQSKGMILTNEDFADIRKRSVLCAQAIWEEVLKQDRER